jgi:hypothetical protein
MSDNKNGRKPGDASILDYYRRLTSSNPAHQVAGAAVDLAANYADMVIDGTKGNDAPKDQEANKYGRNNAYEAPNCGQVCQRHRVKGINKKY